MKIARRALPRIWFLSSKEEISVEKRFAKRSRKEEVKTGRAETDSSIFPTLLSSRKDRDRDRFLVAFDVHFSNDRVSFRLYMDFLNRGNRGLFFFFLSRFIHHVDWNLIEFRFINVWEIHVERFAKDSSLTNGIYFRNFRFRYSWTCI